MKKGDIEEMLAQHASSLAEAENAETEEELKKLEDAKAEIGRGRSSPLMLRKTLPLLLMVKTSLKSLRTRQQQSLKLLLNQRPVRKLLVFTNQ